MSFRDAYRSAANVHASIYGDAETVTYRDPKVDPIVVRATVHPERTSRRKTDRGWDLVRVRTIYLFDHGEPRVEEVREDASIEIGGTGGGKYNIEKVSDRPGGRIEVSLIRAGRAEIAGRVRHSTRNG